MVALIVPSEGFQEKINEIEKKIELVNEELSLMEKIKKFYVVKEKFSINNRMLTPTLKPKRFEIIKNYKEQIEKLYSK